MQESVVLDRGGLYIAAEVTYPPRRQCKPPDLLPHFRWQLRKLLELLVLNDLSKPCDEFRFLSGELQSTGFQLVNILDQYNGAGE